MNRNWIAMTTEMSGAVRTTDSISYSPVVLCFGLEIQNDSGRYDDRCQ